MYGYTVAGGASWGLIRGIQTGLNGRAMIQAIGRTAFITGLAPALFVGLFVNGFTHFRRQCQSKERVQGLVLGTTWLTGSSIVFMHRYVTHVSPYWLGAHVLGFGLFGLSQIDRVSIGDIISAFNLGLSGGSNSPGLNNTKQKTENEVKGLPTSIAPKVPGLQKKQRELEQLKQKFSEMDNQNSSSGSSSSSDSSSSSPSSPSSPSSS